MDKNFEYIILGAGPSGLSIGNALIRAGLNPSKVLILEKESTPGGLCRSEEVDGAPLDIGGGHFLDLKRKEVLDFLFEFMPIDEWELFERVAKIKINGNEIDHPLEANLWQLPTDVQIDYLESIVEGGSVRGDPMPDSFSDWVQWKFGNRIANDYMLPYNRKIWSIEINQLGTYWLHKLPDVSFREILQSCLEGKANGSLPAHSKFLYPKKGGYGELWRRMGEAIEECLLVNTPVENIDLPTLTVNGKWRAEKIITTIPWTYWDTYCKIPKNIIQEISQLQHASIDVDYHPQTLDGPSHWIYEPNEKISYHRKLLRSNFIKNSSGHWTETNAKRSKTFSGKRFHNEFAYPINTICKPKAIEKILEWAHSFGIIGIGRWGKWEHLNSDIAVYEALQLSKKLLRSNNA